MCYKVRLFGLLTKKPYFLNVKIYGKSMQVKSLETTPLKDIVSALVEAFSDYSVPMPNDVTYWENRLRIARLDPTLSFGMFDGNVLIAFILIGVDNEEGHLTAFNTGTGVLPAYRGKGIVDKLYAHVIPYFKNRDISQCALEVITTNDKAIWVYERIGFSKQRLYHCFKGGLKPQIENITLHKIDFSDVPLSQRLQFKSWDHTDKAISLSYTYSTFEVQQNGSSIGYFVIDTATGYIPQLNVYNNNGLWNMLFNGIINLVQTVKINNIDERNTGLVQALNDAGLENFIDQYEMKMII